MADKIPSYFTGSIEPVDWIIECIPIFVYTVIEILSAPFRISKVRQTKLYKYRKPQAIMDEIFLAVLYSLFSVYLVLSAFSDQFIVNIFSWIIVLVCVLLYAVYRIIYLHVRIRIAKITWKRAVKACTYRIADHRFFLWLLPFPIPSSEIQQLAYLYV